jgi:hypothetical protein
MLVRRLRVGRAGSGRSLCKFKVSLKEQNDSPDNIFLN